MTKEKESSVNVGKTENKIPIVDKERRKKTSRALRLFNANHFFLLHQEQHIFFPTKKSLIHIWYNLHGSIKKQQNQ
jgi:hypothetical protein